MLTPTVKEVCQQNLSLGTKVVANSLELVFMAPRKKYLGRLMYHRRSMVHYFFFFLHYLSYLTPGFQNNVIQKCTRSQIPMLMIN